MWLLEAGIPPGPGAGDDGQNHLPSYVWLGKKMSWVILAGFVVGEALGSQGCGTLSEKTVAKKKDAQSKGQAGMATYKRADYLKAL